jgi:hypothetical protein
MLDSGRHDILLADRPRTPWDTSAVTCSSDLTGTSFVRRFGLRQLISHTHMIT